ncbi:LuxR C-terminal-related transcriptional regulator [Kitasatospora sp. NPDC058162]|uniref:LuxR C-terminal-related transcriptional regulator n=1 Tax=Kitasatospora sp. NPDC058162 TaxID=3346362 RepID=UPI0036DA7D67
MLETLGLDAMSEQLYRAMLARPSEGVAELSLRLGIPEPQLRAALDRLSELALVRHRDDPQPGFHTVSPEVAMELLLARQQADLAARQQRLEESRAAAAQLIAECSIYGGPQATEESECLVGEQAIRERLAQLGRSAESVVMTFAPGGAHSESDLRASRGPNEALFERGVEMRTVYLDSIRNDRPSLEHVAWLNSRGGQVRTVPSLPVRMIIIDRRLAVLPLDTSDAKAGAVVLTGPGVVSALCALFESVWANATPLGDAPPLDQHGLTPQEAETLRMLAAGLTDEAIAKRLGISPRTARRITAGLMERLDARSRFQAGVHAVQDNWLPSSR